MIPGFFAASRDRIAAMYGRLGAAWLRIAASPSQTVSACSVACIAAVATHAWQETPWLPTATWIAVGSTLLSAVRRTRPTSPARLAALGALIAVAAWARFDLAVSVPTNATPGATYHGLVIREPVPRGGTIRVVVGAVTPRPAPAVGSMIVYARGARDVREGDEVQWRCVSPRPAPASAGPSAATPAGASASAAASAGTGPVAASAGAGALGAVSGGSSARSSDGPVSGSCLTDGPLRVIGHGFHPFFALRARLRVIARGLLPEPDSSLLLGLLVGDKDGLPQPLVAAFRQTGTSHVLAVSGYNVMLVVDAAILLLAVVGLARRRAALIVIASVIGFTLLAGGDPPVTRAAVMGSAGLLAAVLGRRPNGGAALLLAAAVMLAFDPLALRNDVGFRLSFAAVAGLGAFGRPFAERLRWIPWESVRNPLAETLGATVATLPISLHDFGMLSWSSPAVNVLIAPLIPLATASGAVAVVVSAIVPVIGLVPVAVTASALGVMRAIVGTAAGIAPSLPVQTGTAATVALYIGLVLLWRALRPKPQDSPTHSRVGRHSGVIPPDATSTGTGGACILRP